MKAVFYFFLAVFWTVLPPLAAQQVQQANANNIEVIATENRIKVTNAPVGSRLEIYNVVGIKVVDIEMKQPNGEYVVNIAKGYYIIRIGETVRKVAIR
ncbi:MAG: hypothetical protein LBS05_05090 [Tannerellaceae bacterium]|jgi:hypothetical protein|nr:hypothetical protein [Tannerellaceae bacterium]